MDGFTIGWIVFGVGILATILIFVLNVSSVNDANKCAMCKAAMPKGFKSCGSCGAVR